MSDDPGDLYTNTGDGTIDASGGDAFASDSPTTMDAMTGLNDASLGGDDSADDYSADVTSEPAASDGHVHVDYEGIQFDAGQATMDVTGDGVADTAVQDHGYQVEYYVDSSGDGVADELTITDPDGDLISQEVVDPATGEWIDVTGQSQ